MNQAEPIRGSIDIRFKTKWSNRYQKLEQGWNKRKSNFHYH